MRQARGKQRRDSGWFTTVELCRVFDVTRVYLERDQLQCAPPDCVRERRPPKRGGTPVKEYYVRGVIEAWYRKHAAVDGASDVPDGASQTLKDQYVREQIRDRRASADRAELDLARVRGEMLPADDVAPVFDRIGARLKRAGEQLQQRFGPDAAAVLEDAIEDATRTLKEVSE